MNKLNDVFENAKKAYAENLLTHSKQEEEAQLEEEANECLIAQKIENRESNIDYEIDCYSKELLQLIKKFNFEIQSYEKFFDFDVYDYAPTLETYYCKKNNWQFVINNVSDCDIPEGIFSLTNIKNINSEEKSDVYCDLGCRNTGKERLNTILELFEYNSMKEYISSKYSIYFELPSLLRTHGYTVKAVDFSFDLNEANGYLKLDNSNVFVKVYRAWYDDLKLVVTNNNQWNVNYSNDNFSRDVGYYFNYTSSSDIQELIKCIEAFKSHIRGEIGYPMLGTYYSNSDVYQLFDSLRDTNDYYKECWNHYHITVDHTRFNDSRGYDTNSLIVNKYTGLEIYTRTTLKFNDAAQWSIGDNVNASYITFIYDKRISNKCKLIIDNIIYKSHHPDIYELECDYECEDGDIYEFETTVIPTKHENAIRLEFDGDFMELHNILLNYVHTMCEIHNIDL